MTTYEGVEQMDLSVLLEFCLAMVGALLGLSFLILNKSMPLFFICLMSFAIPQKNRETDKKWQIIYNIGKWGVIIYSGLFVITVFIVLIYYTILMKKSVMTLAIVVLIIWLIISFRIFLKNRLILQKNKIEGIYIRDIEVNYSPAVLSYLINNNIETKKDLSATLLNLCAKNILKIEKDINGKFNVIDLENKKEVEKLAEDEKYAYKMLTTKITKNNILFWKKKVQDEYTNYKFSKFNESLVLSMAGFMTFLGLIVFFVMFFLNIKISNVLMFFIISPMICIMLLTISKNLKFKDNYTRKGAKEVNKWKKFEKFIEDYTLVEEKDHENIVVLGKYLSYSIALGINKKCDKELYDKINKSYSFDYDEYANTLDVEEEKEV